MLEIRRALKTEAKILADLGRATFIETFGNHNRQEDMAQYVADTFGEAKQEKEIEDPSRCIEIAWMGTQAVGFMHLFQSVPDPSIRGPKPIELLRLYVDSRWHGKGVGPALLEKAIQIASTDGFQTLWLGVWERNFQAQAFYRKYRFEKVGQHVFRLGSDDQIDFIMARPI